MVPEDELVARAQAGEEEAFAELVRRYEDRLRAYARMVVRDETEAEDLTQEALVRLYRALPFFRRHASFSTWAFRVMNHLCLDHLRRKKRRPEGETPFPEGEEPEEPPDRRAGPEEMALRTELRARLLAALATLSSEQRAVVVLHDVYGFKYEEIAAIARCSTGTVKSRLFAARNRLRLLLRPLFEEIGKGQ